MIDSIFGFDLPTPVKFVIAFAIVLALIALATWAARRVGGSRLGTTTARGRQPRLAVIDAAAVDSRRRLVLIRRDNVEHLVMIGGPTDVVIEQNIMRAVPVTQTRESPLRAAPAQTPAHEAGIPSASEIADYDETPRQMPAVEPALRPAFSEPPARATPPPRPEPAFRPSASRAEAAQRDPMGREGLGREGLGREGLGREQASPRPNFDPARQSKPANAPMSATRPESDPFAEPATGGHNLSDMANKLEAALRHAPGQPPRRSESPGASGQKSADPNLSAPSPDAAGGPRPPTPPRSGPEKPPGNPKTVFDSLEEEMASLLGRPNGKP